MNFYLKNISLLSCFILIIAMGECKKDNPQTQTQNQIINHSVTDIRDSLVGTYSCVEYDNQWNLYAGPPGQGSDTNIYLGPRTLIVSMSGAPDSNLVINGNSWAYSYYPPPYACDSNVTVYFGSFLSNAPTQANSCYFVHHNDSISLTIFTTFSIGYREYHYYTGHKQ